MKLEIPKHANSVTIIEIKKWKDDLPLPPKTRDVSELYNNLKLSAEIGREKIKRGLY